MPKYKPKQWDDDPIEPRYSLGRMTFFATSKEIRSTLAWLKSFASLRFSLSNGSGA